MCDSGSSGAGVRSAQAELAHGADRRWSRDSGRSIACTGRTLADDWGRSTELRAYRRGRVSQSGSRARIEDGMSTLEVNPEDHVALSSGPTGRRQPECGRAIRTGAAA